MVKLLLIEDDLAIARLYQNTFSHEGYEIDVAKDGEEGLAKVAIYQPTLILLDVMMPKMNGMEVLDRLKANPATASIPVIILTNLSSEQDGENALAKGAVRFIIKSDVEPQQIVQIVKEILGNATPAK